jgi:hypothetical protein
MAWEKLQIEEDQTPLQQKLYSIANHLAKIAAYFFLMTLAIGFIKVILDRTLTGKKSWEAGPTI